MLRSIHAVQPLLAPGARAASRPAASSFLRTSRPRFARPLRRASNAGCVGDSAAPFFLRDTSVIVGIGTRGAAACAATGMATRLDTPSARAFLGQFVTLS
jgi:hypothetical protein